MKTIQRRVLDEMAAREESVARCIIDETLPGFRWKFDASVADVFEDMLTRSIPQYEVMRELCASLALSFARNATTIVDLGCSRGDALDALVRERGVLSRYLGIEISEPMLTAARKRFAGYIETGLVEIRSLDLRTNYPRVASSVTQSILTLQFIPIEYRQRVVQSVYDSLLPGGAFILVEKILARGSALDALMVEKYLDMKRSNGYTEDQIERKRLSLEGVLVPITAQWNETLLENAGFRDVDCFWRHLNFAGWIAVKR
jgi:tRNA (cmo5U34)-methyltransferase